MYEQTDREYLTVTLKIVVCVCHDHVIPTFGLRYWSLSQSRFGLTLTIIAVTPCYLFGLGPAGLHQPLCLNTAQKTPSITEQSLLCLTLRTLDTIITLTVPILTDPLM
jgi:hypothetical protein